MQHLNVPAEIHTSLYQLAISAFHQIGLAAIIIALALFGLAYMRLKEK
jgi:hypothetical protein